MSVTRKTRWCVVCRTLTHLRCANCRVVHYCCAQHQKANWFTHKLVCKMLTEQFDSTLKLRVPQSIRSAMDACIRNNTIWEPEAGETCGLLYRLPVPSLLIHRIMLWVRSEESKQVVEPSPFADKKTKPEEWNEFQRNIAIERIVRDFCTAHDLPVTLIVLAVSQKFVAELLTRQQKPEDRKKKERRGYTFPLHTKDYFYVWTTDPCESPRGQWIDARPLSSGIEEVE